MNRWTGANLILALLAGLLLALQLSPRPGPAGAALTDLDPSAVAAIRVERDRRLQLALQRDETGWRLTHPWPGPAEETRVRQLLAITRARVQHEYPAGDAPAGAGTV